MRCTSDRRDEKALRLSTGETPLPSRSSVLDAAVALVAIGMSAAHDFVHIAAGNWPHVFWMCDLSAALVGPAILLRSGALSTTAFSWLLPGTIVWAIDIVKNGSAVMPTSWGIHLGALVAAIYAVRRFGAPRSSWKSSAALLAFGVGVSRLALPESANINVAYSTPSGWTFLGESRAVFALVVLTLVAVVLSLGARAAAWIADSARGTSEQR